MDAEVAVIGTGTMGSMTAWQLAKAGIDTVAFEQFSIGHDRSAAGGESRIFRTAYLEGPQYVPTLLRARELWRELEAESGHDLLTLNGGLMIGPEESESMRNVLSSIDRFSLPHEVLDRAAMAERYPQHRMLPGETAILDRSAGVLRPEFAVLAAARRAETLGARVVADTTVTALEPGPAGVLVRTPDRDWQVEQAVVTAGPWTARFAPDLAAHVSVQKLVMTWYMAEDRAAYRPDRFPIFIRDSGDVHFFGIPTLDGGSVKIAPHASYGQLADADDLDRFVGPAELVPINDIVARFLPGLVPTPIRVSTYMDAYTTDRHPIVGAPPGVDNVWLLGAFSGHGFKMSPAIGQIAADLVRDGKTDLPVDHLDPRRFLA